ncbi:hypothetical protein LTS08_006170 [Lithohypha guttulata]|uniref:Transcription initiation factor TFIID subunit 13 n=1 Tax=Lithohypha guttulata TaxID=1690604 RepID=A0AAN7SW13_9EURO|nr:hypothetical protein LTR05_006892 [Lithohypha guttulata]KAK5098792.1 hypothetical protein LTS08_006170 [Lithohypha guttulata]
MEPRARAGKHKAGLNFGDELRSLLYGAGAPAHPDLTQPLEGEYSRHYLNTLPTENKNHPPTPFAVKRGEANLAEPYPETLRVLDEIVTDYIIEMSHSALEVATYAGRAKLKVDDFLFSLRKDQAKLGRVYDFFGRKKKVDKAKRTADQGNLTDLRNVTSQQMQDLADVVGEEGTGKGKGRGRGRKKKRGIEEVNDTPADYSEAANLVKQVESGGIDFGNGGVIEQIIDVDVELDDLEAFEDEDDNDKHRDKRTKSVAD